MKLPRKYCRKRPFLELSVYVLASLFLTAAVHTVQGIGVADIAVTSVYWGSQPAAGLTAHPGDSNVELSVVVANVGDDIARRVSAILSVSPPFIFEYYLDGQKLSEKSISRTIGDLAAGSKFTLQFTLSVASTANEGIHRMNLELRFQSARELRELVTVTSLEVPIWRGELHMQRVATVPEKIYPGDTKVNLKVWLVNSGTGATKDVEARLELKSPFKAASSGSAKYFIGRIPPGQVSEANFFIDVDDSAKFGDYSLRLLATTGAAESTLIGAVPLFVNEKAAFSIVEVTPDVARVGDSGVVIKATLKNNGRVTAESVRVQLKVGNFFSGTLTDFLGKMGPGEEKTAYLTVDVDGKAEPRSYKMDLRLDWTQDNNSLDETLALVIKVMPRELPTSLGAVLLVVVAGGLFYYRYRKRRLSAQL